MNFLETWSELEKLYEWHYMNQSAQPATKTGPKTYQVTYYNDGVKKSFTLTANTRAEAEQIAWSKVEADSLYVTELEEALEQDSVEEALRVVSDPDVLYHYTNPTPFLKIFKEDCLRADIKLNAVCLTTDKEYIIYDYPCGIQLSRKRLLEDGYEFVPFDEFEDDTDAAGESEERIYGNINKLSKYVTAVHINWQGRDEAEIAIVSSSSGDRIADAVYDEHGNENETYDLMLRDFRKLLDSLRAKGIKVIEQGRPIANYYLTDEGDLEYLDNVADIAIAG